MRHEEVAIKPSACTNCGKVCDSATDTTSNAHPEPGDATICFYCHHLMLFADDMTMRDPTPEEVVEMAGEPEIVRAMNLLERLKTLKRKLRNDLS